MIKYGSFVILMNLGGSCQISVNSTKDKIILNEGESCLIPAAIANYHILPYVGIKVLEAFIDSREPRVQHI
jgi:mannose-6-phosphate isomerase